MNKFNNPARNRLAERQAVRAGKVDGDLAAANVAVASTSALSIDRVDVCPKCKAVCNLPLWLGAALHRSARSAA